MKRFLSILYLIILVSFTVNAQNYDKKWGLSIDYGSIEYRGELGDQFFDFSEWQSGYGIQISRYLTPSFDGGIRLGYNFLSVVGPGSETYSMNGDLYTITGNVVYKFTNGATISENAFLKPYIKASSGLMLGNTWGSSMDLDGDAYSLQLNDWVYSLKAGTKVRITENIHAFIELGNLWVTAVGMDGSKMDIAKDQFYQLNIGVSFALGSLKDSDRDGVSDKNDLCPDTPSNVVVDELGCPYDNDGDGLADYQDECPDDAGGASTKGCPDRDQDGLADKYDNCPDEPGDKSNGGCPFVETAPMEVYEPAVEGNNDEKNVRVFYVYQGDDVAPVIMSSPNNNGMAYDSDGDGISDNIDLCPKEIGSVENYGCPVLPPSDQLSSERISLPLSDISVQHGCPADLDCDGITDDLDQCPESPGAIRYKGCPIEKLKPKWRFDLEMKPVHFMSGRTFITEFSKERVDRLIQKLNENSKLNVWMFGHSDPSGPSDFNVVLSEKRINTIVEYMLSKGVSKERIFTIGLGESFPVSIVFSPEGQLLNRRVDFYLFEFNM